MTPTPAPYVSRIEEDLRAQADFLPPKKERKGRHFLNFLASPAEGVRRESRVVDRGGRGEKKKKKGSQKLFFWTSELPQGRGSQFPFVRHLVEKREGGGKNDVLWMHKGRDRNTIRLRQGKGEKKKVMTIFMPKGKKQLKQL